MYCFTYSSFSLVSTPFFLIHSRMVFHESTEPFITDVFAFTRSMLSLMTGSQPSHWQMEKVLMRSRML